MALIPVNFRTTRDTVNIDCRNPLPFDPFLTATASDQLCVFANPASLANRFDINNVSNNFHNLV